MKNKENLVVGILAGVAFGAAMGMLFAPQKGTVIRRIIRRKGEDIADKVSETIIEPIGQLSETITEKFESLKNDVRSRFSS